MKYLYMMIAILFLGVACDDDDSLPVVKPAASGTDIIEGVEYGWVRIGDQEWMTSNLKAGEEYYWLDYDFSKYINNGQLSIKFSESRETEEADYDRYGNLYEWERACEVCAGLPNGWRLPSDKDWQKLERALGMDGEAAEIGWRGKGIAELMRQGEDGSGLKLQMSGCYVIGEYNRMQLRYVQEKGFYWCSDKDEEGKVYYRKFHYNSDEVYRSSTGETTVPMMRVRCVRDVVNN